MFDAKKYYHDRYFNLKNSRKCVRCGKHLEESSKTAMCEGCRVKHHGEMPKWYEKNKLCVLRTTKK